MIPKHGHTGLYVKAPTGESEGEACGVIRGRWKLDRPGTDVIEGYYCMYNELVRYFSVEKSRVEEIRVEGRVKVRLVMEKLTSPTGKMSVWMS